ncbi:MAG: pimeloyl-ACP methyl ester carboxylesterase [Acidimicrobiales bacterium]|jgi:pimeloyl-ACP methyl ester carboxylesterase
MSGNPVLLVHGFTTSAQRTWVEPGWVDLLREAGREVIAPDLLGHGSAPKPHDTDAYAAVEELVRAQLPEGQQVDAVGYSAGARIVMCLASAEPERFGRIVVGGMGGRLFKEPDGNPILDALEGRGDPDNLVNQHFKTMAEENGNDPLALAAFLRRSAPELGREQLGQITAPTLVIIGDKDFAGPGEPLAEAIPDAQLVTLKGIDHFGLPKAFAFVEQGLDHLGAAPF